MQEDGMRVTGSHVFTGGAQAPTAAKNSSKLTKTFQKEAPINMSSQPLTGRVETPKSVTKRGDNLSKQVLAITRQIPTPFLVKKG